MHACRAFLTDLSCLQPPLLKRRYVSQSPPILLSPFPFPSLSLHCIDNIEYFHVVALPSVVCWSKAAVPYVAKPLFQVFNPAAFPSHRHIDVILFLSHWAVKLQICVYECVCLLERLCVRFLCLCVLNFKFLLLPHFPSLQFTMLHQAAWLFILFDHETVLGIRLCHLQFYKWRRGDVENYWISGLLSGKPMFCFILKCLAI